MKKINLLKCFLWATMICVSLTANAQVTIGSSQIPNPDAVLDLVTAGNDKGFLPPRIPLVTPHDPAPLSTHVAGMTVYNTTVLQDSLQEGLYVNNGTQWVALVQMPYLTPVWFYMPSFPINVSAYGTFAVNLWEEYSRQFDNLDVGSVIVANPAAPSKPLSKVYAANELNYYVIGYDDTVFSDVSIKDTSVLSYTITSANLANVSGATYMNIVFVVK